jgi:phage-related baseplate assembly protein
LVYLTLAAANSNGIDFTVDPQSALLQNLRLAMDAARDTVQRFEIASYAPLFFKLEARLLIDPAYLTEKVIAAATTALTLAYSFAQRAFGQPIHVGEVLATLQGVDGVQAAFVDQLYFKGQSPQLQTPLPTRGARRDPDGTLQPAQLLLLEANGANLTPMLG